jgi:OOP family OmpA-OmpF porin
MMKSLLSDCAAEPLRRRILPGLAGLLLTVLWTVSGPAQAVLGYLTTEDGQFVRNNYGECWHTSRWRPELAVPECEGAAPEPEAPRIVTLTLDEKAFFDFDRSELKLEAREKLDALITELGGAERIEKVHIVGHADRIGSDAYNDALSMRRAVAVRDYLLESGLVPSETITLEARGEREPVESCEGIRGPAAIRCLAPNRRVEITVHLRRAP